jgi:hypothetical protein
MLLQDNHLERWKSPKTEKVRKKMVNNFAKTPVFLPKQF